MSLFAEGRLGLIAIDDFVLADHAIPPGTITNASERLRREVRRRDGASGSRFFGSATAPATWTILIQCPDRDALDALLAALERGYDRERWLLAQFSPLAGDVVQTRGAIAAVRPHASELNVFIDVEAESSAWVSTRTVTASKTFTDGRDQALALVVPGNTETHPTLRLTPTGQRATMTAAVGWRYRQRWTITNGSDEPLFRYPVRISLGNTMALVSNGKALASGADVRVWLEGLEIARTLVGWNGSASHLWIVVPACPAGGSVTVDVVYGNPSAGGAPGLVYPDLPAFNLATSTNAKWIYDTATDGANAGKGLWYLGSGDEGAVADYGVPGAWRPALTFDNPLNQDRIAQSRAKRNESGSVWYQAQFQAFRGSTNIGVDYTGADFDASSDRLAELAGWNPFDGVAFHNPFGVVSVRSAFRYLNYAYRRGTMETGDGAGGTTTIDVFYPFFPQSIIEFVILARQSGAEGWRRLFSRSDASGTYATIALATYAPTSPVKHIAFAVWPRNMATLPSDVYGVATAESNGTTEVNLNTATSLGIVQIEAETEIYELATEIRVGGGANGAGPYHGLLIGNARGANGEGAARVALSLGQTLVIDCETHAHAVWNGTATIEDVPGHAVRAVTGVPSGGATTEFAASNWLPLRPGYVTVPNGDFSIDIASWGAIAETPAGMTVMRAHDPAVGSEQAGSLAITIGPSTAASGAILRTAGRRYRLNGQEGLQIAATVRTSNTNLRPELELVYYQDADDTAIAGSDVEAVWTPAANTWYRRVFAIIPPGGVAEVQLVLRVRAEAANQTGTVWFDDVTLDANELVVQDVSVGALAVVAETRGHWL